MSKDITFIIPNYNGEEILNENLPQVISIAKKYNAKIIIGDDASKDESIKLLKEKFKFTQIKEGDSTPQDTTQLLIQKNKNEGFSSNVNLCISYATTPLLLLLNTDAVPTDSAIDHLIQYFEDTDTFAVGMVDTDDDDQTHGRGKFIFHNGFLLHDKAEINQNSQEKITTGWVSCGSGLFSREIWNNLNGLDPLFNPFYFEDVDIGYRAWKSGYSCYIEPKAKCIHLHKKGSIKKNYNEDKIKTISYRNQFIFNWKNLTDSDLITKHLNSLPKQILIAIKNNDKPFLKGLLNAVKLWPKIKNSRSSELNHYTKTDSQIIAKILEQV
jgi:GT2 family glycosyltransferase